jgi:hypothetical protein
MQRRPLPQGDAGACVKRSVRTAKPPQRRTCAGVAQHARVSLPRSGASYNQKLNMRGDNEIAPGLPRVPRRRRGGRTVSRSSPCSRSTRRRWPRHTACATAPEAMDQQPPAASCAALRGCTLCGTEERGCADRVEGLFADCRSWLDRYLVTLLHTGAHQEATGRLRLVRQAGADCQSARGPNVWNVREAWAHPAETFDFLG